MVPGEDEAVVLTYVPGAELCFAGHRFAVRRSYAATIAAELEAVEGTANVLSLDSSRAEVCSEVGAVRIGKSGLTGFGSVEDQLFTKVLHRLDLTSGHLF
jgi:hypothetical protein